MQLFSWLREDCKMEFEGIGDVMIGIAFLP